MQIVTNELEKRVPPTGLVKSSQKWEEAPVRRLQQCQGEQSENLNNLEINLEEVLHVSRPSNDFLPALWAKRLVQL